MASNDSAGFIAIVVVLTGVNGDVLGASSVSGADRPEVAQTRVAFGGMSL